MLAAALQLAGCGEKSTSFALSDGCYYAEDGTAILSVRGEDGVIITPSPRPNVAGYAYSPVHRFHVLSRLSRDGAYLEVSPGFYLTDDHGAALSGQTSARFVIAGRSRSLAIMVPTEAYGAIPVRLGRPCGAVAR